MKKKASNVKRTPAVAVRRLVGHGLDVAIMKRLYNFGGLMAYRVTYFDPLQFKTVDMPATFSEELANEQLAEKKRYKFTAGLAQFIIKFDGAFAVMPNGELKNAAKEGRQLMEQASNIDSTPPKAV